MSLAVHLLLVASGLSITEGAFPSQSTFTYNNVESELQKLSSVSDSQLAQHLSIPTTTDTTNLQHSTSLRMSRALNEEAADLQGTGINRSGVSCSGTSSSNLDNSVTGEQYIHKPGFFACFLQSKWGQPDILDVSSSSAINGQKGVVIFLGCSGTNVQNRVDLWDGADCYLSNCEDTDFTTGCNAVRFYTLA